MIFFNKEVFSGLINHDNFFKNDILKYGILGHSLDNIRKSRSMYFKDV